MTPVGCTADAKGCTGRNQKMELTRKWRSTRLPSGSSDRLSLPHQAHPITRFLTLCVEGSVSDQISSPIRHQIRHGSANLLTRSLTRHQIHLRLAAAFLVQQLELLWVIERTLRQARLHKRC
jgi:hypothetical protein